MRIFKESRKLIYCGNKHIVKDWVPKALTIVGTGFTEKLCDYKGEIWATNNHFVLNDKINKLFYFDKELYDLFLYKENGRRKRITPELLNEYSFKVISIWKHPKLKNFESYPLQQIWKHFGIDYFTSTFAYMMAYAIWLGYKEINLYGVEFNSGWELCNNEKGCMEFWIAFAKAKGVKIRIPEESYLCQPAWYGLPKAEKYLGYKTSYYLSEKVGQHNWLQTCETITKYINNIWKIKEQDE